MSAEQSSAVLPGRTTRSTTKRLLEGNEGPPTKKQRVTIDPHPESREEHAQVLVPNASTIKKKSKTRIAPKGTPVSVKRTASAIEAKSVRPSSVVIAQTPAQDRKVKQCLTPGRKSSKQSAVLMKDRKVIAEPKTPVTKKTAIKTDPLLLTPPATPAEEQLEVDPALLEIVHLLTHREPLGSKPKPRGKPEVWATERQELCETLPYYKSHRGGCYANGGTIYSFMLDGAGHVREYMDENLIICRAGGNMESDGKGKTMQAKDHSILDNQPQALLNNIAHQNPVIMICGDRNTIAFTEMPQKYCVLGWYKPTHVWAEKVLGKGGRFFISIRYRFERLDRLRAAWYAPEAAMLSSEQEQSIPALDTHQCTACGEDWPIAMLSGWMCLNSDCTRFWIMENGKSAPCNAVRYHPSFLRHETHWPCDDAPFDLNPGLPEIGKQFGDNLQYIHTRGVVCPQCGRCNARYRFTGWRCDTRGCEWSLIPQHQVVSTQNLHHNPWDTVSQGPAMSKTSAKAIVQVKVRHTHGYKVVRYTIPGVEGCVIHAKANRTVVKEHHGPDDMFEALQREDIGLVRRTFGQDSKQPAQSPGGSSQWEIAVQATMTPDEQLVTEPELVETLAIDEKLVAAENEDAASTSSELSTVPSELDDHFLGPPVEPIHVENGSPLRQHVKMTSTQVKTAPVPEQEDDEQHSGRMQSFSINFGMPYKFVAGGDSQSFEDSAWLIRACRSRLNWALRTLLSEAGSDSKFNELLAIGYMERQKIGYHDDGEAGLGPVIASLSLGAAATMSLRLKSKYFSGASKTGVFTYEQPLPLQVLQSSVSTISSAPLTQAQWDQRSAAFEELREIKANNGRSSMFMRRSRELARDLGLKSRNAAPLLDLHLTHGDIMIMQGEALQKYFEHAVEPHGSLRFALTCRQILPHHLSDDQKPSYVVGPDTYDYDGSSIRRAEDREVLRW